MIIMGDIHGFTHGTEAQNHFTESSTTLFEVGAIFQIQKLNFSAFKCLTVSIKYMANIYIYPFSIPFHCLARIADFKSQPSKSLFQNGRVTIKKNSPRELLSSPGSLLWRQEDRMCSFVKCYAVTGG